jgi:hypothetical protein
VKTFVLAFALVLGSAGSARATTTTCYIHNAGTKPVTIRSVGIPFFNDTLGTQPASTDTCTDAPLAADRTCSFTTTIGVYGGGIAKVKGSTKNLRGECTLYQNTTGLSVITVPMR